MSEDLPKQDLLIKLMGMTQSSNDSEALVALRKANSLLASAGWDWNKLISGKIVVVEDPFKNISTPPSTNRPAPRPEEAPPRPEPQPAPQPYRKAGRPQPQPWGGGWNTPLWENARTSPPPPPPRKTFIASTKPNKYSGWCWCCGNKVPAQSGFIFNPFIYNKGALNKWTMICTSCNSTVEDNDSLRGVKPSAAPRNTPKPVAPDWASTPDLNNL